MSYYRPSYELWTLALYLLVWLIPWVVLISIAYLLLRLPLRRQERARLFLDLLESGLKQGRSPEQAIIEISRCGDRVLGWRFHLLAAHMECGLRLSEALKEVSGVVPPPVAAMLEVGTVTGYLRKILPECRAWLTDGSSRVTSGMNYLVIVFLVLQPFGMLIWPFLATFVVPKFAEIMGDLSGTTLPLWVQVLAAYKWWVAGGQAILLAMVLVGFVGYVRGPWSRTGIPRVVRPIADRFEMWLPWRRMRLQRTFSRMLAVLLDAEVPERHAVLLAAESTANNIFIRRAEAVVAQLRAGVKLTEAVSALDDAGEFRWRLTNATAGLGSRDKPFDSAQALSLPNGNVAPTDDGLARRSLGEGGFMQALAGWCEALDAKAYQQEQAWSQVITTGLVIVNGVIVGLIAVGLFQALTSIIKQGVLW